MVPKGWKSNALGRYFDIKSGVGFKLSEYVDQGIPLVKIDNVSHGYIKWDNKSYVPENYSESYSDICLEEGDILLALNRPITQGMLKIARITKSDLPAILYQRVGKIVSKTNETLDDYFYYALEKVIYKFVENKSIGSDQPFISTTELKKVSIYIPPLPEQKKIAEILSTWDKAITTTEQLLANSQQQKKALMQQLLTGKKRLHDHTGQPFTGEWEHVELADIFHFKKGNGLSKGMITESGPNKCVLYGELYTKYSEVIDKIFSRTDSLDGTPSKAGDILIPSSTTTSGIDLANATAILENDVLLGGDINILRPKILMSSVFMAHVLTHTKKHEIASRAQGITIIHLYGSDLKGLKIRIPSEIKEQQKIAAVLTSADNEIDTLKQKLDYLKQEKKALMQQLLTGKRRVKVEGSVNGF
jgi:type I restriction enzyme S subunit